MIDLIDFATQAENYRGRDVRMVEHALQRALQLLRIWADGLRAAVSMGKVSSRHRH